MRYILLIYGNENPNPALTEEEMNAEMNAYNAFTQEISERGVLLSGDALQSTATATTVRVRDSKVLTTDGPFAETKEQLGGFYMVQCNNLDEAIEWAAKIPGAQRGSIEIRPVMEFE
ncbi:MAG: YciI family protein [Ktedonobacteraceae bacterium]